VNVKPDGKGENMTRKELNAVLGEKLKNIKQTHKYGQMETVRRCS